MRLKNVPYAKEKINCSHYVILNPENYKGHFNDIFNNNNPIHLEIGTGKGSFIIEMALKYPHINFIGVEKYASVLVRALEKIENQMIPNLKFINMDANYIENVFQKEIDLLYLNFSDPWPKNRHQNRRLTSPIFLKKYDAIFNKECHIMQKTDNQNLFIYSIMTFNNYNYKIKALTFNLHESLYAKDNVLTEYEAKFSQKGMPIYYIEVEK